MKSKTAISLSDCPDRPNPMTTASPYASQAAPQPVLRGPTMLPSKLLFSHKKHWAHRFGIAPFLPMSRAEMDTLGWDSCDVIIVTGDAYVDHPSFGMAIIGRLLERHGFRVGILSQPDWQNPESFKALGAPNLFFGVTGGNMDSMVNRYTADKRLRHNDSYTAGGEGGKRPDRSVTVYAPSLPEDADCARRHREFAAPYRAL
jgi:Radical SAM N-terminal